jgi:cell division protein ZapA (FtsZ GTPase activity inhibitor)
MGKISLKVNVGGRTYPLTVNEEEQERVLKAADDINKAIKMLQENYAVKDMQDLLAMSALQLSTKSTNQAYSSAPVAPDFSDVEAKLNDLSKQLDALS